MATLQFASAAQDGDGNWLGAGDMEGRREANGIAGAAVFADSNFTPDPNIPEGPQAPGAERYCFIGQPHARVCTSSHLFLKAVCCVFLYTS